MKKLILITLFFPIFIKAQTLNDSIRKDIITMERSMLKMKGDMNAFHNEFNSGIYAICAGAVAEGFGAFVVQSQPNDQLFSARNITFGMGGLVLLIGTIVIIDSHKYFGHASRWGFDKNAFIFKFE